MTRLSEITYLDKLYIPNFSVILPGSQDSIWVYNGKGTSRTDAIVSAYMEAIERYSSLSSTYSNSIIRGTYLEILKSYGKVLHPGEVVEPINPDYNDRESVIEFTPGFDLMNSEDVWVPAQLALSKYTAIAPAVPVFPYSHTNGLAAGNVIEEAICHALCEVIERDASSIADLCSSSIPYTILENIANSLRRMENGGYSINLPSSESKFVDDPTIYQDVDISEVANDYQPLNKLVKRFTQAKVPFRIKNITQADLGIPTFVASSVEWISSNYGLFAKGYGTHPDAKVAVVRALSEVSQTRAGNIQGARDDLRKIQYEECDEIYKRRWQFMPSSKSDHDGSMSINFFKIKSYVNDDILDDIKFILGRLRYAGLKKAIIVNLTNSAISIPVVRALVPGLETFEVAKLFMANKSYVGNRAIRQFLMIHHDLIR